MLCVGCGNRIFAKIAVFVIFGGGILRVWVDFGKEFGIKIGLKMKLKFCLMRYFGLRKDFEIFC